MNVPVSSIHSRRGFEGTAAKEAIVSMNDRECVAETLHRAILVVYVVECHGCLESYEKREKKALYTMSAACT